MLRIAAGRVYDPANGVAGEVRDVCVQDGKIVADVPGHARRIDARGTVVMPGGVDIHAHIAGPAVNAARKLSPEEHQKFPGDTEAQVGQGAITFHSEEHLMSSDQGVSMLRNLLRNQVDIVAKGDDPVGVAFDEASAYVKFDAGQFLDD